MDEHLRSIIEELAAEKDVASGELSPPLYESIDTDALAKLVASETVRVSFDYEQYEVTVTRAGDVRVRPRTSGHSTHTR